MRKSLIMLLTTLMTSTIIAANETPSEKMAEKVSKIFNEQQNFPVKVNKDILIMSAKNDGDSHIVFEASVLNKDIKDDFKIIKKYTKETKKRLCANKKTTEIFDSGVGYIYLFFRNPYTTQPFAQILIDKYSCKKTN